MRGEVPGRLRVADVAERAGLSAATLTKYLERGRRAREGGDDGPWWFPEPDGFGTPKKEWELPVLLDWSGATIYGTHVMWWWSTTIDVWLLNRRGRGQPSERWTPERRARASRSQYTVMRRHREAQRAAGEDAAEFAESAAGQ